MKIRIGSKVSFNVGRGTFVGKVLAIDSENETADVMVGEKRYTRLISKLSRA